MVEWKQISPNVWVWPSPAGRVVVNADIYGPRVWLGGVVVKAYPCPPEGWPQRAPAHLTAQAKQWAVAEYLGVTDYQI